MTTQDRKFLRNAFACILRIGGFAGAVLSPREWQVVAMASILACGVGIGMDVPGGRE